MGTHVARVARRHLSAPGRSRPAYRRIAGAAVVGTGAWRVCHDIPSSAKAYEFYLRANALGNDSASWELARDLYLQCVEIDRNYAPAWARLGRIYRVLGKFRRLDEHDLARAESALNRALELNPGLPMADSYYAQLELDVGRAQEAMVRLVRRASSYRGNADLFAGLVSACRYCGLLQPSLAAHEHAQRLDPNIRTSVQHVLHGGPLSTRGRGFCAAVGKRQHGRACAAHVPATRTPQTRCGPKRRGTPPRRREGPMHCSPRSRAIASRYARRSTSSWPGSQTRKVGFYNLLLLANMRDWDRAIEILGEVVDRGFFPHRTFARHAWFDPVRDRPAFIAIRQKAERRQAEARTAFLDAGGEALLGSPD